jgi:hypothetical protein
VIRFTLLLLYPPRKENKLCNLHISERHYETVKMIATERSFINEHRVKWDMIDVCDDV